MNTFNPFFKKSMNNEKQAVSSRLDLKNSICNICKNEIRDRDLVFSCGHTYCGTCFSIPLVASKLESKLIQNNKISYYERCLNLTCIICSEGSFIIKNDDIVDLSIALTGEPKIESNDSLINKNCSECEIQQANIWCKHCGLEYCEKCANSIHSFKSFQHHETLDYANYLENKRKNQTGCFARCGCGFNRELEMFCGTCQKFMCKVCIISDFGQGSCLSRDHELQSTYDLWNVLKKNITKHGPLDLNFAKADFKHKKAKFLEFLKEDKQKFIQLTDFLIQITKIIKVFCEKNAPNQHLKNQLLLIQESFSILEGELETLSKSDTNLNPLKLYYISKLDPKKFISDVFPEDNSKVRIIDEDIINNFNKFIYNLENLDKLTMEELISSSLVRAYNLEKLITDGEAEFSDANRAFVDGISNGALQMKTCAKGHDNQNFEVRMEEIKSTFVLEAGTIWVPKSDQKNEYQPLIQKNSCKFTPGNVRQNLFMFCGDQSKKSPHDQEYLPTAVKLKTVTNQQEVWEKTKKYTKK